MALPEACGLWIEQRIEEELKQREETGVSLSAIGRKIASEVQKYFETKVNPDAIRKRASRSTWTNVQQAGQASNESNFVNPQPRKKQSQLSQHTAWNRAESRLKKIVQYMMDYCEVPADIPSELIGKIERHVDTLQTFIDEIGKTEDEL